MTDQEIISQIVAMELVTIRNLLIYRDMPLAAPTLTEDVKRRFDHLWEEAQKRGLQSQIKEKIDAAKPIIEAQVEQQNRDWFNAQVDYYRRKYDEQA